MSIDHMLPALTIGPSSHRTRRAQLSELLLNMVGLCFWKGVWSSSQVLKSSLVARADRPHSAAATPLIQQCWMAAAKSQICPLESWERPQGMPAVILIKNMLPRGKTQPLFAEEGPNPALVPHDCPRLPGLMLMSWCRAGASPSGSSLSRGTDSLVSGISPLASKIPKESQTWTSQQIKWNATEPQL